MKVPDPGDRWLRVCLRPPFPPHSACITGSKSLTLPFCPSKSALALFVLEQRLRLLTIRPFLAPCIRKTTLESGASGIESTDALTPPWIESILVATSMSTRPCRSKTRSGSLWFEERSQTGPSSGGWGGGGQAL